MKICKNCGKQFKLWIIINNKKRSLQHRKFCLNCSPFGKHNTSKIPPINGDTRPKKQKLTGKVFDCVGHRFLINGHAWNKGKQTSKNQKEKIRKALSGRSGRKYSEEEKQRASIIRKQYLDKNPHMHPNRLLSNNKSKCSYPEKLVINYFTEKNIDFEHQKKIGKYWVDFLVKNKTVLEVDGQYWHNLEVDKKRDKEIEAVGYKVVRIPAVAVIKNLDNVIDSLV